jgi:hypothetical protein
METMDVTLNKTASVAKTAKIGVFPNNLGFRE